MKKEIKAFAKEYAPCDIEVRRHLYQHPELIFCEFETQNFIREKLLEIGLSDI